MFLWCALGAKGDETERKIEVEMRGMTEGGTEELRMRGRNLKGLNYVVLKKHCQGCRGHNTLDNYHFNVGTE